MFFLPLRAFSITEMPYLCCASLHTTIGMNSYVGGTILHYEDSRKVWYEGGTFNKIKGKAVHRTKLPKEVLNEVTFITGCLQLIKRKVLTEVGLLPEHYFIYYEDLDYCIQVAKKGYKLIYDKRAVIYHKCGGTASYKSPTSIYYSNRNYYLFIKKFFSQHRLYYLYLIIGYFIRILIKLLLYKVEAKKAVMNAFKCNFLHQNYNTVTSKKDRKL
ncbi:glycosyltransferase family 2 protein [Anoxybacillus kestanbolensis]|uniref:glycosyltransferase family 2 protein n=1 Tax=Anoxybacillus kestanbolensis TaxID=227476 RepID=UPI003D1F3C25